MNLKLQWAQDSPLVFVKNHEPWNSWCSSVEVEQLLKVHKYVEHKPSMCMYTRHAQTWNWGVAQWSSSL